MNLVAGAVFLWLAGRPSDAAPPEIDTRVAAEAPPDLRLYAIIALLAGFAMMTLQTVVIRLSGLSFGASPYTFSMVVAIFVLGIAIGSFAIGALERVPTGAVAINLWIQSALLLGLFAALEYMPWMVYLVRGFFRSVDPAFPAFVGAGLALIAALVGPVAVFSGATLPLVFHELRDRFGDLGAAAGSLYSWNTVGSLLGALLGGYALFFFFDLSGVYRIALGALVVAAGLSSIQGLGLPRAGVAVVVAMLLSGVALLPAWRVELLSGGLFRERQPSLEVYRGPSSTVSRLMKQNILFYDDDPVSSIKVIEVEGPLGMSRSILSNGKGDGNTLADFPTMSLAGLLPVLLGVEEAKRAFVIGYGTGVTAGELAALPSMEEVIVAEISPAVADAAPLFDFSNQNATSNPKLRIVRSDAYRALQRAEDRFDVIVSEPSNPWMAGVDMLFTQEFLTAARDRLTRGGVYAQWYHQYETSHEAIALVLRTYATVFDRVVVWYGKGTDLLLFGIAGDDPLPDLQELERRMQRPAMKAALERTNIRSLAALVAHELVPEKVVRDGELEGPIHHLTHPRLGFEAARAFFSGKEARLPYLGGAGAGERGRGAAYFPRLLARARNDVQRDALYRDYVAELCRERQPECAAALAAWERDLPTSRLREETEAMAVRGKGGFLGVKRATLRKARMLFEPRPDWMPPRLPSSELADVNSMYAEAYHHPTPFEPRALRSLWNRCDDSKPGDCERGRQQANRILTRVGVDRSLGVRQRAR